MALYTSLQSLSAPVLLSGKATNFLGLLMRQSQDSTSKMNLTIIDSLNAVTFEYIYNGGAAVCDLNNDGMKDLFFTGNMVSSRLYLNKGNLEFTDVTH